MDYVEFTSLICSSLKNNPGNGPAAWRCGTCMKGKGTEDVGERTAQIFTAVKAKSATQPEAGIMEPPADEVGAQVTKAAPPNGPTRLAETPNPTSSQDVVGIPKSNSNGQARNNKTTLPPSTISNLVRWCIPSGPPPTQPANFINLTPGPSGPSFLQYPHWGDASSLNHSTSPMRTSRAHTNIRYQYDCYENHDNRNLIVPETSQAVPPSSVQSNRSQFTQPMSLSRHKRTGPYRPRGRSSTVRDLRGHRNHARHPEAPINDVISTVMGHVQNSSTAHSIGLHRGGDTRVDAEKNHSSSMSPSSPPTLSTPTDDDDSDYVDQESPPQRASRPTFANAAQRERWRAVQRNKRRSDASKRARKPPPPGLKKKKNPLALTKDQLDLSALQLTQAEKRNHAWLFNKPITQYYPRSVPRPPPQRPTTPRNGNEANTEMDVDLDSHQTQRSRKPTAPTQLPILKSHRSVRQRGFSMVAPEVWEERIEKGKEIMERSSSLRDADSE
ncbi:hypothetical protein BD410DRAFT_898876 [Rickenella mellea]|uniref:Uncharacterized protein n=1 Tax=Rickenella mellea TaxID=50990 RepID=A0A4Y7Q1M9_9AGAM|nr:hypothetical protein BD410DRAFT_898876 [Rickenella mellea]